MSYAYEQLRIIHREQGRELLSYIRQVRHLKHELSKAKARLALRAKTAQRLGSELKKAKQE